MKKTITSLLTFTLVLLATVSAQAQVRFERGRLYVIRPNSATGQSWSSGKSGEAVKLGKTDATDAAQQWTVTELSGSYRLINPFSGLAAHATADGRVAMTEDNGSDESQLWLIEPVGEAYLLVPSNGPSKAARQRRDGTVELIDKAKARTDRAAQFRFEPWPDLTAKPPTASSPSAPRASCWVTATTAATTRASGPKRRTA